MPADELRIALLAELLRIGRFVAEELEARDAAALLVDRDDRLHVGEIAQVVDQFPELRRRLDVPAEEDVAARLDGPEFPGGGGIEFGAGNADEEELTGMR